MPEPADAAPSVQQPHLGRRAFFNRHQLHLDLLGDFYDAYLSAGCPWGWSKTVGHLAIAVDAGISRGDCHLGHNNAEDGEVQAVACCRVCPVCSRFGLCSILNDKTHMAVWIVLQLILALGMSLPIACLLPSVQAPLSDQDTATSTAAWAFLRSFGSIWGVAIPAAISSERFGQLLWMVEDEQTRQALSGGMAYAHASPSTSPGTGTASGRQLDDVIQVYSMTLQRVWQIGVVFAGVSVIVALAERELPMRETLETDFGLQVEARDSDVAAENIGSREKGLGT